MKVKRYVVNALPEALPMIRSELGPDAIILNTKEIRVGGFLGMFGKKKMEVIAAIENNASAKPAPPVKRTPRAEPADNMSATLAQITAIASLREGKPTKAETTEAAMPYGATTEVTRQAYSNNRGTTGTATLAPLPVVKEEAPKQRTTDNDLMNEIRDMKQWIVKVSRQQQVKAWSEPIQALYDRLSDQEVNTQWIEKLIEEIEHQLENNPAQQVDRHGVWDSAKLILTAWLKDFEGEGLSRSTRVVHFVGPTGVGKTTSIAKLAAEQTLKAGRKVGFITSDTYRIAAVDQLRTYATILNVPLEVVFSPLEVSRAFKQLEERDLIFMDTAGRNYRNELYVSEVNSLLHSGDESETYLVLSLTGKFKDMSTVAEQFSKYGVRKVLFTKQDETNAYGAILNLALEKGFQPTYIAYGQTVPDDIALFRSDSYVLQLLGAADHE
ncbi:flagellar biosynthesis regulator FlhF [Paenibacillus baekrokdamisoli]|uniref:Flagellar biosynthesis protein FlhF n=1 Tax=Paenibacillus baekrokdamisoli TaxID=1712516 RepID=A0A3G9IR39_9BACL|nr:flagellar biosynthesis protein FlhF [Paenibacillus baekrokdamisoli]MBB3069790.1 flagellar biosynthesis protein FlhF [Paenibacillus baekrokdamisoli]BBH20856.1 flagellar biosynthesis regulator FlhF [Paenibacillus baekrokdamisoli]